MPIPGNLLTTAMAVMPHKDVDRALEVALSLNIPFWPQLPKVSYYEDMYVQAFAMVQELSATLQEKYRLS